MRTGTLLVRARRQSFWRAWSLELRHDPQQPARGGGVRADTVDEERREKRHEGAQPRCAESKCEGGQRRTYDDQRRAVGPAHPAWWNDYPKGGRFDLREADHERAVQSEQDDREHPRI